MKKLLLTISLLAATLSLSAAPALVSLDSWTNLMKRAVDPTQFNTNVWPLVLTNGGSGSGGTPADGVTIVTNAGQLRVNIVPASAVTGTITNVPIDDWITLFDLTYETNGSRFVASDHGIRVVSDAGGNPLGMGFTNRWFVTNGSVCLPPLSTNSASGRCNDATFYFNWSNAAPIVEVKAELVYMTNWMTSYIDLFAQRAVFQLGTNVNFVNETNYSLTGLNIHTAQSREYTTAQVWTNGVGTTYNQETNEFRPGELTYWLYSAGAIPPWDGRENQSTAIFMKKVGYRTMRYSNAGYTFDQTLNAFTNFFPLAKYAWLEMYTGAYGTQTNVHYTVGIRSIRYRISSDGLDVLPGSETTYPPDVLSQQVYKNLEPQMGIGANVIKITGTPTTNSNEGARMADLYNATNAIYPALGGGGGSYITSNTVAHVKSVIATNESGNNAFAFIPRPGSGNSNEFGIAFEMTTIESGYNTNLTARMGFNTIQVPNKPSMYLQWESDWYNSSEWHFDYDDPWDSATARVWRPIHQRLQFGAETNGLGTMAFTANNYTYWMGTNSGLANGELMTVQNDAGFRLRHFQTDGAVPNLDSGTNMVSLSLVEGTPNVWTLGNAGSDATVRLQLGTSFGSVLARDWRFYSGGLESGSAQALIMMGGGNVELRDVGGSARAYLSDEGLALTTNWVMFNTSTTPSLAAVTRIGYGGSAGTIEVRTNLAARSISGTNTFSPSGISIESPFQLTALRTNGMILSTNAVLTWPTPAMIGAGRAWVGLSNDGSMWKVFTLDGASASTNLICP